MLIRDSGHACIPVNFGSCYKARAAGVRFGQSAGDIVKVPSAGGIDAVQMHQLSVTCVFDNGRR